jgi:CubicO group peptidase (beta-lactamase class C family)
MKNKVIILVCVIFSFVSAAGQKTYFPDAIWQSKNPEDLGLNKSLLDSAIIIAIQNENNIENDLRIALLKSYVREPGYKIIGPTKQRGGPAGVIIKNGYIAAQWGDVDRVDMTFSATKSFLSTVAGLAVDRGLITSVKDPVKNYVSDESFESEHNSKVNWEHLLHQSSDWSGTLFGLHDWADRPSKVGGIDEWRNRTLIEPGTVYEYNDVRVNLLAYSLLNVWRKPLPMVLKENIMDPIGASTTWRWYGYEDSYANIDGLMMQSVSGGGHHGGGIFSNTLDMARFGLLFLRNGKWRDKHLISEKWIQQAIQPSMTQKDYGYLWWLNVDKKWENVPSGVFYALGYGGNYIIVDRDNDMVIVVRWVNDKVEDVLNLIYRSMIKK